MFYGLGAVYDGTDDMYTRFIQRGVACIGWSKNDAPAFYQMLAQINVGDFIFIKSFPPKHGLYIKAIGIVRTSPMLELDGLGNGREVQWLYTAPNNEWISLGRLNDHYDFMRGGTIYPEYSPLVQEKILDVIGIKGQN